MPTQDKQPAAGVNPGGKGPAQPQHVEDPHPANEEYTPRNRDAAQDDDADKAAGSKRPSDTADKGHR